MSNLAKHNVSFEEAATVFADQNAFDDRGRTHSHQELRRLRLGRSASGRVLVIVYTVRRYGDGEKIRIISARPSNREEELGYTGIQD